VDQRRLIDYGPTMDSIEINGIQYGFDHLREFVVRLPNKGRDSADLRVAVTCGSHVVSRSCDNGSRDLVDESGKPRQFCADRYTFSKGLPDLIRAMIVGNYSCWESKDRNQALNYAIIDANPAEVANLPDGHYWVIYFYLYPSDCTDVDVRLCVVSCHERQIAFRHIRRRFSIHMLLRRCLYTQKRHP
jgi:hypothetical protein